VSQRNSEAQILSEARFSDSLTGVGFAEAFGNEEDKRWALDKVNKWLDESPSDICVRALAFWSTFVLGNLNNMADTFKGIAEWLFRRNMQSATHSDRWTTKLNEKVQELATTQLEQGNFVRRYVEDTLVRAALLRYIKAHEQCTLIGECRGVAQEFKNSLRMQSLLRETRSFPGNRWVTDGIKLARRLTEIEEKSRFARFCLIWFTGRQPEKKELIQSTIEETSDWLERYPNEILVRWATLWLAGLDPRGRAKNRLIEKSAEWLEAEAPQDECVVRHGYLWLVGETGKREQVEYAVEQTTRWLNNNPEDDFIRIAFLLFLIKRAGTPGQWKNALDETRKWLHWHPDPYGLTRVALGLCESRSN
jgi:hypothetical protein